MPFKPYRIAVVIAGVTLASAGLACDDSGGSNSDAGSMNAGGGAGGSVASGGSSGGGTGAAGRGGAPGTAGAGGSTPVGGMAGNVATGPCHTTACMGTCRAGAANAGCSGTWTCDTQPQACTSDIAEYCGCDGKTFTTSGSCPNRAFAHRGACDTGADCDARKVLCKSLPPMCPTGRVSSVFGTCWGPCVPIDQCACAGPMDCPEPNKYTCQMSKKRCTPFLN
jgi:hypothetical protein